MTKLEEMEEVNNRLFEERYAAYDAFYAANANCIMACDILDMSRIRLDTAINKFEAIRDVLSEFRNLRK